MCLLPQWTVTRDAPPEYPVCEDTCLLPEAEPAVRAEPRLLRTSALGLCSPRPNAGSALHPAAALKDGNLTTQQSPSVVEKNSSVFNLRLECDSSSSCATLQVKVTSRENNISTRC